jgi:hypothetical protein
MEPSKIKPSATLTATIQEIQSYPKYVKRNLSDSQPANIYAGIDKLVKAGKLTQEQANLAKGANPMSMFGTLLNALQNTDGGNSTDSTLADSDPFSILMDAFKANDDTQKSDSPLFDTLAGFMPTYDPFGRLTSASAAGLNTTLSDALSSWSDTE